MVFSTSRRDFLRYSAAVTGAVTLGNQLTWAVEAVPPKMVITRWSGPMPQSPSEFQQAVVKLTEQTVQAMGGISRFVKRGDVVWIKPNIGWDRTPELAANTNPDLVATLVRLCYEAGAKKVKVGDNPCDLPAKAYASSGIADAAKQAGAEVVFLDRERFRETDIKGERVKSIPVLSGTCRKRRCDQRPDCQTPCAGHGDLVYEELHGRDRESSPLPSGHPYVPGRHHAVYAADVLYSRLHADPVESWAKGR